MSNKKPGLYMTEDREFVKHPSGEYVDICDYKNCRQPCEERKLKCPLHYGKKYPELEKSRRMRQLIAMLGGSTKKKQ